MPTLEFLPDDWGKKNRGLLWKKFTESDTNQWYGPTTPWRFNRGNIEDFQEWMESPSSIAHPSWYDPTVTEKAGEVATTDTMGHGQTLKKAHGGLMYITPEQYQDDVNAMIYYGSFGLMDPTNVADIPFWRSKGFSSPASVGLMLARATIPAMILGWWIDPADKREGGLAEEEWYEWITDPSYWFGPGKWY